MKNNNLEEKNKDWWIAKFEEFLKENECYEEFEQNIINERMFISIKDACDSDYVCIEDFVSICFSWKGERYDFWSELDEKWIKRYEQLMEQEENIAEI